MMEYDQRKQKQRQQQQQQQQQQRCNRKCSHSRSIPISTGILLQLVLFVFLPTNKKRYNIGGIVNNNWSIVTATEFNDSDVDVPTKQARTSSILRSNLWTTTVTKNDTEVVLALKNRNEEEKAEVQRILELDVSNDTNSTEEEKVTSEAGTTSSSTTSVHPMIRSMESLGGATNNQQYTYWTVRQYPNPTVDIEQCRSQINNINSNNIGNSTTMYHFFCDPDSVVSSQTVQIQQIESTLTALNTKLMIPVDTVCTDRNGIDITKMKEPIIISEQDEQQKQSDNAPTTTTGRVVNVQLAIALMKRMNLSGFNTKEDYVQALHNQWGVGYTCNENGGTGILVFLSEYDRFLYISRGAMLASVLTNHRLDTIIDQMKPYLQKGMYTEGLLLALSKLQYYIETGEPQWKERFEVYFVQYYRWIWLFAIGIFVAYSHRNNIKRQQEYTKVATQLNDIDYARALALQGKFHCTSCPICLEAFIPKDDTNNYKIKKKNRNVPSNSELENDDESQGLLLSEKSNDQPEQELSPTKVQTTGPTTMLGSDKLPLKLLRCGHVFDTTCWEEWVSTGRGKINKCPICQQDVGATIQLPQSEAQQACGSRTFSDSTNIISNTTITETIDATHDYQQETEPLLAAVSTEHSFPSSTESPRRETRVYTQYTRERHFRLERLAHRYPQYIRPDQVTRWTQINYDQPLASDPSFVATDPSISTNQSSGSSNGRTGGSSSGRGSSSSASFGGGRSGGGRGSSW